MRHSTVYGSAMAVAAVAAALALPAGASAGTGTITGLVTDDEEYEPIANARVATSRTRGAFDIETRTDAEGKFTIGGLEDGIYDVAFFPPEGTNLVMEWNGDSWDYGDSSSVVVANGEPGVASADLSIGATISGRITTRSGSAAAKACVHALALDRTGSFRSGGKAATDSDGRYKIIGLAPGVYKMWFGPVEAARGKCEGGARNSGFEETWRGGASDFFSADPTKVRSEEEREGVDAVIGGKDETGTGTGAGTTPPPADACVVPRLRGTTVAAARKALSKAKCKVGKTTRRSHAKVKRGRVVASKPKAGTSLPVGSKVELVVSKGAGRKR